MVTKYTPVTSKQDEEVGVNKGHTVQNKKNKEMRMLTGEMISQPCSQRTHSGEGSGRIVAQA